MLRKAAILMLVAAVVLTGATACPRGAAACPMVKQATHDCCGNHLSLRTHDCCRGSKQLPAPTLTTAVAGHADPHVINVASMAALPSAPNHGTGSISVRQICRDHGLAPPDTLVTRHASLLL
jgi:hypothetical protein